LSALIAPEAREHARRWFLPGRQGQWIGQVVQVVLTGDEVASGAEALDRATVRQWGEDGDRAPPIGDLDRLAGLHPPQQLARSLPELAHSHRSHVLVIAHYRWSCRGGRRPFGALAEADGNRTRLSRVAAHTGFEDSNSSANVGIDSKAAGQKMTLLNIGENLALLSNGSNSDSVPATVPESELIRPTRQR
jgi:hypothetical protein